MKYHFKINYFMKWDHKTIKKIPLYKPSTFRLIIETMQNLQTNEKRARKKERFNQNHLLYTTI